MHLLLNDTILTADIDLAHSLLDLFYSLTNQLYPIQMNFHLLVHVAKFVCSWWCYSCFGFESMVTYKQIATVRGLYSSIMSE
jgi:hypothetical protein